MVLLALVASFATTSGMVASTFSSDHKSSETGLRPADPGRRPPADSGPKTTASKANAKGRPNIVVVMSDDQTVESMRVMGNVLNLIGGAGTTFEKSYVSYSLCCPSRATFLTGQYAHNHGVLDNELPTGSYARLDHSNTLPVWLQRAGYHTVHIGKYLNGYGVVNPPLQIPPGWSEWYASFGAAYFNYALNENGKFVRYGTAPKDYDTDVFARKAVDIIRRRAPSPTPFFLEVWPTAPHFGQPNATNDRCYQAPKPAPRHRGRFRNESLPKPPSFNEANASDKPASVRNRPVLNAAVVADITQNYRCQLESLLAVDEAVKNIVTALDQTGELDDTLVIYTSDNGFFNGEHRVRSGKILPYEESIQVPLLMRGPGVPGGKKVRDLVANVDLAPTILDAAKASSGRRMDGRSLFPLMKDRGKRLGRAIVIETAAAQGPANYTGVRTSRYAYVQYATGERELYDMNQDPYELQSALNDGNYARGAAALAADVGRLRGCSGGGCRERPAVKLRLRYRSGRFKGRRCVRRGLRARIGGSAAQSVDKAEFSLRGHRVGQDVKPPFERRLPRRNLRRGHRSKIRALVSLVDGRLMTLDRRVRGCGSS